MTKQESPKKQSKKDMIAAAALSVLSKQGLAKASIKEIAKEAGVPPGLVHYHFTSKDELLAKVVRDQSRETYEQMNSLRHNHEPGDFLVLSLRAVKERIQERTEFYRARFEAYPLGLATPEMKETIREVFSEARAGIAESAKLAGFADPKVQRAISNIVLACFDGLALQYMLDPKFGVDEAFEELIAMLDHHRKELAV